jgi:translation initiation factor IF-2
MAAAKEFNIGKDTLVDFLVSKGFSKDDLKPTSKLSEDMYRSLQQEFNSDKVAKHKSDQIDLPKGSLEAKKKKEEEAQLPPAQPQPLFKKDPPPVVKKPKEETPPPVVEEAPAPPPPVAEPVREEPEVTNIEAPELEGPKVVTKIDLSTIDSSTRPKKGVKKEEAPAETVQEEPVAEKPVQPEAPVIEPVAVEEPPVPVKPVVVKEEPPVSVTAEETFEPADAPADEAVAENSDVPPVIENIRAEKLEGPKILGKIELPANSDTRPKQPAEEKRKRKRIPIEKRDHGGGHGAQQGGGRPGQQHGGGQHGGGGPFGNQPGNPRQPGHQRPPLQRNTGGNRAPGGGGQGHGHGQGGGNRRPDPRHAPREAKEIDKKEIQEKIRQTQAKLAGAGGRGKSLKAKYRRAKRDEAAEMAAGEEMLDSRLQVTEFISVSELANLMDVSYAEVIGKCMSLGMMVSINQRLEADVIELVAGEFGYTVEFIGIDDAAEMEEEEDIDDPEDMLPRSPVVTIAPMW